MGTFVKSTVNFVQNGQNRKRTTFNPTFKMSTYLVAWAVVPDDFKSASVTTDKGVKVSRD